MQLDAEQQLAVRAPRGPVCIVAGAGTGKTRTITHRMKRLIQEGQVNPSHILAVTFTKRAAGEMRDRLTSMGVGRFGEPGVQVSTFHAAAFSQLKYFWPQIAGNMSWEVLDGKKSFELIRGVASYCGVDTSQESVRDFIAEINWAKSRLLDTENYLKGVYCLHHQPPVRPEVMWRVLKRYEEVKQRPEGVLLDFNDLLLHMSAAFDEFPGIAEEFRSRYRSFVVDEYQDVNPAQQRLLDAWLGDRDDLTVVGDPNQTIYSFSGASPEFLINFRRRFPHATIVNLVKDYRSTPEIVQCANKVIADAKGTVSQPSMQLEGQQQSGDEPQVLRFEDDFQEAEEVATAIAARIAAGERAEDIAILYRMNSQSMLFEQALEERHVPYHVRDSKNFFQRPEIQEAYRLLERLGRRSDLPPEAFGPNLVPLVQASLRSAGLTSEEPAGQQARERWQGLTALVRLVEDMTAVTATLTLQGLLQELRERADKDQSPTVGGVTLASIHAAKGLEWDTVYVVGLTDGVLPISYTLARHTYREDRNDSLEGMEEERRLLYVAITRARQHLILTWSESHRAGGRSHGRCRFLDSFCPPEPVRCPQIIEELLREWSDTDSQSSLSRPAAGSHAASSRTANSRSGTGGTAGVAPASRSSSKQWKSGALESMSYRQQELFEKLVAWRKATAAEIDKPAFVVFTDRTLINIALQSPRTSAELAAIHGIGKAKLEAYGEAVLRLVADSL